MSNALYRARLKALEAVENLTRATEVEAMRRVVKESTVFAMQDEKTGRLVVCVGLTSAADAREVILMYRLSRLLDREIKDGIGADDAEAMAKELEIMARKLRSYAKRAT